MPDLVESFRQFAMCVLVVLFILVSVSNGPTDPPRPAAPTAISRPACPARHPFPYLPEDHYE